MPWQRHVADVATEVDPGTGRLVYRDVVLTVPRQSGKSTLILALTIHRALLFGSPQRTVYAAQTRLDAKKKLLLDWLPLVQHSPFVSAMHPVRATGEEAFAWDNGSLTQIVANTEKAGHGSTLDLGLVDEAFSQVDNRLEQAFSPAMITRPQPQFWVVSTAGTAKSVFLNSRISTGRVVCAAPDAKMAYFEWSADPAADPADPATWASCMPALGFTVTQDAVAAELDKMRDNIDEFRRAYMNLPTVSERHEPIIAAEVWDARCDRSSRIHGPKVFSLDVSPDRGVVAIGVAGRREDGRLHGEVVQVTGSTAGVVDRLVQLSGDHGQASVVIDAAGAAGSLLPELETAGVPVRLMSMRDAAAACGQFYDAVVNDDFVHIGQPLLDQALAAATKRPLAGAWALNRRRGAGDISPAVAVINATFAAAQLVEAAPNVVFI